MLEGIGAGVAFGVAEMLATGAHRVPPRVLVLVLGFGIVVGLGAGIFGALAARVVRWRGVSLALVVACAAGLNGLSLVSREIPGEARATSAVIVGVCAVLAGALCIGAKRRSLGAAFLLCASASLASLAAWFLPSEPRAIVLASTLPLALALLLRVIPLARGHGASVMLALATAVLLALPVCVNDPASGRPDLAPAGSTPSAAAPDVVLIVIDTLRTDALDARVRAGDGLFARLATEGVRFENCISAAPWTLPSVASLLTSLLPSQHGAVASSRALPTDVETLAEAFAAGGYSTAAFTGGAFVSPAFRIDQGFEHFDATPELGFRPLRVHVPLAWRFAKNRYATQRWLVRWIDEFPGVSGLRRAAEAWYAERDRSRPAFLLVHTYEVHDYYLYHAGVDERADAFGADNADDRFAHRLSVHPAELQHATQPELDRFHSIYAARLEHVEHELDALLSSMDRLGERERVVVVVSDHGEGFDASRGRIHHGGRLHDDLLRVPLLVSAPGSFQNAHVVTDQVRTIDVMPTLLELAGLPATAQGTGESLVPRMRGVEGPALNAWSEEHASGLELLSLRTLTWKLVRDRAGERAFHLAEDPLEMDGYASAPGPLLDALRTFTERVPKRTADDAALDRSTQEQLRNLGYVD